MRLGRGVDGEAWLCRAHVNERLIEDVVLELDVGLLLFRVLKNEFPLHLYHLEVVKHRLPLPWQIRDHVDRDAAVLARLPAKVQFLQLLQLCVHLVVLRLQKLNALVQQLQHFLSVH